MFARRRASQPASPRPRRKSFFSPTSFFHVSSHERRRLLAIEPLEYRVLLSSLPVVSTDAASAVSATGATLNGTVNPEGATATPYFQYSADSTFAPTVQTTLASGLGIDVYGEAVDAAGDVFVAAYANRAVQATVMEVLPNGTINTIVSGLADANGVAVDAAGDVFVANDDSAGILKILPNGTINTVGSAFNTPSGVAVDAAGDVFVADSGNNAVKEVLPNGAINTIGSGIDGPYGVAVDAAGDAFVDDLHARIVKLSPVSVAATPSSLSGSTATAVSATLPGLTGGTRYYYRVVASSSSGVVAGQTVAFATRGAVVAVAAASPVSATGATLNGTINPDGSSATVGFQYSTDPNFTPTVATTIGSGFNEPSGVAVDAFGDVFVADYGDNAVKEVLPDGTIKTIGSGFDHPTGVAVDAFGDVFVADHGNNAVKEVLPNGKIETIGAGFNEPSGVAVDASDDVFVADTNNSAVKEVLPNGTIETIGSAFSFPTGVAVDAAGDVFVADRDNNAVKEVLPNGTIDTIGSGFSLPYGVAVDAAGDVFVADHGKNAIQEVLPNGTIDSIGSGFLEPLGVAVDASGGVFVADYASSRVVELSLPMVAAVPSPVSGSTATAVSAALIGLTPGTTYYFRVVAASAGGTVAVTPLQSFTTLNPPTVATAAATSISTIGATLNGTVNPEGATATVSFQFSTSSIFPPSVATTIGSGFDDPSGVAVDAAGDVFVADSGNNSVKEVLPNGTIMTLGSGFNQPSGVAVDVAGDVFVADSGNDVVKEVLPDGAIETIGSGFTYPKGVALDASGDVFVADSGNNAIKEVLPNGTIKIIGSEFNEPSGVAVDASGDVFVADYDNNSVKEVLSNGTIDIVGSGFLRPSGVAVDAAGDVFVADAANGRVKEVLPNGAIQTIGSGFSVPAAVAEDASGDVFVADAAGNRVEELSPPTIAATPPTLSGATSTVVTGTLDGLEPGTVYYDRAVATDTAGTVTTAFGTFATPPLLAGGGPAVTYNTGGPPIAVAPDAALTTGDASLDNTTLSVKNTNGGQSDRLGIQAAGGLTKSGAALSYNGTVVGAFAGGAYRTPLVVTFNANATQAAILAVAQNVTFRNSTLDPGLLSSRSISFQLTDGAGNHGAVVTQTIKFTTPPVLAIGGAAVTYNTGGPHITVAPAPTLSSGDGDFAKASLSIKNTNGGQSDRLGIRASGNLTVSGTTLGYSGTAIGTFAGGAYKTPLVVTFNASATQAAILAVAQNVTFWNTILDPGSLSSRTVSFQLTDGADNHGAVVTQTVKFVTPPALAINGPAVTYPTGGAPIAVAPAAALSVGDGLFAKSSLSVADTNAGANDRLGVQASGGLTVAGTTVSYDGTAIGTFTGGAGSTPLVVTFNTNATQAAILAVVQNITFTNTLAHPGNVSSRLIHFQLTDGGGNKSAVATQTVMFSTAAAKDAVFAELA